MRLLNLCLMLFCGTTATISAPAQTLASFDFSDASGAFSIAPDTLSSAIALTGWEDLDGTLTDYAGNPDRALGGRDFVDGNGFVLTLVTAAGVEVRLQDVSFDHRASSTGPTRYLLMGLAAEAIAGTTEASFMNASVSGDGVWRSGSIELLFWADGAASNSGTWRIDNVTVNGEARLSAVPVPAALWLMAGPVAWILRPRRSAAAMPYQGSGVHSRQAPMKGKYSPTRHGRASSAATARA